MSVFVLDKCKKPLMPCSEKRARLLLERGRAVVHKKYPFTIRIKDRTVEGCGIQPVRIKIDPGSKTTGIALVREDGDDQHVLHLAEIEHRGSAIRKHMTQRAMFRRGRRSRNLRHRKPRFKNRRRSTGWLPPSLQSRVNNIESWVDRYRGIVPITALSVESVKFDMQKLEDPEISGIEYQWGELQGYEVREYLLEKWNRTCAYCGVKDVPLQIEHVVPKSRGGSNRISNLTLACGPCNDKKGSRPVEDFLAGNPVTLCKVMSHAKKSLAPAAAVNATRNVLVELLQSTGLPVETATGGQTKYNRTRFCIPKEHCLDAVCVGSMGSAQDWNQPVFAVKATGRGSYKRTRLNKYGFPRGYLMRQKSAHGFRTGDIVYARVPNGKAKGAHFGRVAIRATGWFDIQTSRGVIQGVSWKRCARLNRADGYGYHIEKRGRCYGEPGS